MVVFVKVCMLEVFFRFGWCDLLVLGMVVFWRVFIKVLVRKGCTDSSEEVFLVRDCRRGVCIGNFFVSCLWTLIKREVVGELGIKWV